MNFLSILLLSLVFFVNTTVLKSEEIPSTFCSSTECYVVVEKLGEGAFGEVFSVKNSQNVTFALKSYKKDLEFVNTFLKDSEREFLLGQQLDHPNIIKSVDLFVFESPIGGTTDNLVLELVEGKTFAGYQGIVFTPQQALNMALQLSGAVAYAESQGLIHMDLHGNNVMINDDYEIKIIDIASFFTGEELIQIAQKKQEMWNKGPGVLAKELVIPEKLEVFFAENPIVVKELMDNGELKSSGAISDASVVKRKRSTQDFNNEAVRHHYLTVYYKDYFTRVARTVKKLLEKSSMKSGRQQVIKDEISALITQYNEDVKSGNEFPLGYYLEELKGIILKRIK